MERLRRKWLYYAVLTAGCLHEAIGCPQLLGNAFKDGTRSFFESDITAILLSSFDFETLLGLTLS
jgi:hypothetical protein